MPTSLLVALLLGWLAPGAVAQSIEAAEQRLLIGRTPWLRLHLRGFELDPARLGPECVRIRLTQGDTPLPDESLQIGTASLARDGKVLFEVTSSVPLHEPLLHARVELDCGARYTRELSLLVDPPLPSAPQVHPESRRKAARPTGEPAAASPTSRSSTLTRPTATQVSGASRRPPPGQVEARQVVPGARLHASGSQATPRASAGARLQIDAPDMEQLVTAVLHALAQRPGLPTRHEDRTATPAGLRPFEADWLRELQRLQEEQRQARAQLAALQLRLERQESETLQRWGAIAATAAGLIAASLLLRLALERRLPRLSSRDRASRAATPPPAEAASPADGLSTPEALDLSGLGPRPPGPRPPPRTAAPETPPIGSVLTELPFEPPVAPQDGQAAPVAEAPPPRAWPGADFGEPSLLGRGSAPALRQVDAMSAAGYPGAAVTLLENALQARPGKNPWLLLRLLDLYRTMNQPWNHERVSAQLEALYNVRVPPMRTDGRPGSEGRDLLDCPDLLERLVQVWSRPASARDWLHQRLLRDAGLPAADLATFRDLLLLHDLARLRQEQDEERPVR
ncbi:MAG: hypothetical protein L6Q75_00520 [Burkholderiaceae bacterium]|nr:hypothetical protein [Burkholderiaceae bacterium]